jgi:peptidoglycan/LPS O-acetylase OafA/YrhL
LSAQTQKANAHRYLFLDGLRGLGALAIIVEHVPSGFFANLVPGRHLGLPFFFVLSGFVMAHAYGQRLLNGMSMFDLFKVRFARLYPIYFAGFAIGLSVTVFHVFKGWNTGNLTDISVTALFGLLMLPSPPVYRPGLYPFNGPAWTLAFEMITNMIYGAIAPFLNGKLMAVILVVSAVGVTWTMGAPDRPWQWSGFWNGFWMVNYGFFAGVLIYQFSNRKWIPQLPFWLGVVAFFGTIGVPGDGAWRIWYDVFAILVIMPGIVACFARTKVTGTLAEACVTLGLVSYGMYVLHVPVWDVIQTLVVEAGIGPLPEWLNYVLVATVSFVAAYIMDGIYDRPFRRFLARVLGTRKRAHAKAM